MDNDVYNRILDGLDGKSGLVKKVPVQAIREMVVCICVAAFNNQELESVELVLEQLAKQNLDRSAWSVVFYLNWPQGAQLDGCEGNIKAKCEELGLDNVFILKSELPKGTSIGRIRWMLHTAIARRAEHLGKNPHHVNVDCDSVYIHPEMLASYKRELDSGADLVVGELRFDHPKLPTASVPVLALAQEMLVQVGQAVQRIIADPAHPAANDLVHHDILGTAVYCNMAWRNEIYVTVGGMPLVRLHEWHFFFRAVWEHTAGQRIRFCNGDTLVAVNSRRWLWAYHFAGFIAPNLQWAGCDFAAFDTEGDMAHYGIPTITNGELTNRSALLAINQVLSEIRLRHDVILDIVRGSLLTLGLAHEDYRIVRRTLADQPEYEEISVDLKNTAPLFEWGQLHCTPRA